jgi:branched-chain amino acid transport system ATP-binding protein
VVFAHCFLRLANLMSPDGRAVDGIVAAAGQFAIIREINRDLGVIILLVQQNARAALSVASHGYIMEQGKVVLDGSASELRDNEDVKEFYLGGAGDQRKSFKNLKSFKRRKRWL